VPGPGYYFNPSVDTSFKLKAVPEFKQFFGSQMERFIYEKPKFATLGPGSYDIKDSPKVKFQTDH